MKKLRKRFDVNHSVVLLVFISVSLTLNLFTSFELIEARHKIRRYKNIMKYECSCPQSLIDNGFVEVE